MRTEAELTFMLARRAVLRWRFDTDRLLRLAGSWSASRRRLAVVESAVTLDQVKALVRRLQPLSKSGDAAVRRQAQGLFVALDAIADQLGSIVDGVSAESAADEIRAAMVAPTRARPAAPSVAGGHGRSAALAPDAFRERRGGPPGQVTRFEPRYIDYLTGRGPGRATPGPAVTSTSAEQGSALAQLVLETAYLLWEQDGQPTGRADVYWREALERHWTERAWVNSSGIDDAPPDPRRLEADAAASAPEMPTREDQGSAPASPDEGRQAYQEVVDAFAELAATLVGLANELEVPPVSPSKGQPDRPDQGGGASDTPTQGNEEERGLKQGRYIKGRGVVWSGEQSAGPVDPARTGPAEPYGKLERQSPPRLKRLPPRPKKKGWGGA